PAMKSSDTLGSLVADISGAIDSGLAADLWRRSLEGEPGIFTRDLYTARGQQTFDVISRRYQADEHFRAAVDRYCGDFEKLLKNVRRNDSDHHMAQTYLASDTGKVYTMLAHAAGRLQ